LNDPRGLALDPNGNLFIADHGNRRIRKIAPNGVISTIAGTGIDGYSGDGGPAITAQIGYVEKVAVDNTTPSPKCIASHQLILPLDNRRLLSPC